MAKSTIKNIRVKVGGSTRNIFTPATQRAFRKNHEKQMAAVVQRFHEFVLDIDTVLPEIIVDALEPVYEESQRRVPVGVTGDLKDSGFLRVAPAFMGVEKVQIGYAYQGRPHYSIYVHDIDKYKHKYPTSSRFLSSPIEEDYRGIADRINSRLSDVNVIKRKLFNGGSGQARYKRINRIGHVGRRR